MHSDVADGVDVRAINNAGDIVGQYQPVGSSESLPFMRTASGTFGPLPVTIVDSLYATVSGINDSGMAIGTVTTPALDPRNNGSTSVYWQNGQMFEIGNPAETRNVVANGLNNNGVVVGDMQVIAFAPKRPYMWSESGGFVELDTDGLLTSGSTIATGINDNGLIIGRGLLNPITPKALYWTPEGELNILDGVAPGENERVQILEASAVNNSGVIIGRQVSIVVEMPPGGGGPPGGRGNAPPGGGPPPPVGGPTFNALVWLDNQPLDLMDLTVNLADLPSDIHFLGGVDINASGQILVSASINGGSEIVTFVLTSVPAPGGATLLGIADRKSVV